MDPRTHAWWTLLRIASVLNIAALVGTAVAAPLDTGAHRIHLACAAIYTFVCAFRSFWPRVDLERTVLVDHPLSSIALGRTSATLAEMAFTVQCAVFVAGLAGPEWFTWVGVGIVPLIALAQICCWLGVLTLNHLWHAAEESLWGVMMGLLALVFVVAWPGSSGAIAAALPLAVLGCAAGAFVMLVVDVPMYVRRWRQSVAENVAFLGIREGFTDALRTRRQTGSWDTWKHEVTWMTPYFTGCVWLSIALVWL